MPLPVAFLGTALIGNFFVRMFVVLFDSILLKYGRKIAWFVLGLGVILATFAAFWAVINGLVVAAKVTIGVEYFDLIPMFLPSNLDEILAGVFAVRVGSAILVFNAQYVKLFMQF